MATLYRFLTGTHEFRKCTFASDGKTCPRRTPRVTPLASLIPRDPRPNEKYQAKVPTKPSKVQDLLSAPVFGPRGVLLFGFKEEEESVVRRWLAEVEASLPVLAFRPSEGNGLVDTVEAALAQIEQANSETLTQDIIEYLAEGYPPLPGPVVLFSGLVGEEVVGLLEAWQSFTGLERPAAGAVVSSVTKRKLSALLYEILRAQASEAADSSKITVFGKEGSSEAENPEDLRRKVQEAVEAQRRQRRRKEKKEEKPRDESDARFDSLRAAKRNISVKKDGKGFQ